ncbi:NUDIX hydrolase (plasmid) [Candidatus Megaera polyxenophila]|nr:NUDIX hydrolase [Candidatus Megaera polyxenophila]
MNSFFKKPIIFFLLNILCVVNVLGKDRVKNYKLQVAVRALVVNENKLLLVSNEGNFWYTPGGRLNSNETLPECIVREVKEETGIDIQAKEIVSVYDFFDKKDNIHKVEVYFTTKIKSDVIPKNWKDQDGPIKFIRFFSHEELKHMKNVAPSFLKDGVWLKDKPKKIYEGYEVK